MQEDKAVEVYNPQDHLPAAQASPYEMLLRQSKKMGTVATKAFQGLKTVLNSDLPMPIASQPKAKTRSLQQINHIKRLVKRSNQVIATARTVFPMTPFPHSIVVDRTKITIIKRDFFFTSRVISIQIEDILNVETGLGPFFGSLTIASRVMSTIDHFQINYFWRHDAIILKHIIQGYVIAKHNGIDTSQLGRKELIDTLLGLGHDSDKR